MFSSQVQSVKKEMQPIKNACLLVNCKKLDCLEAMSDGQLIRRELWPTGSPYLNLPDLLLQGFLKNTVYSDHPHTPEELQVRIRYKLDAYQMRHKKMFIYKMVAYTYVQNMANTLNSCNLLISVHSPWVAFLFEHCISLVLNVWSFHMCFCVCVCV